MLFTRCPDCETTFRITAEALRKADGQVRCGRCARVFNAYHELRRRARRKAGAKPEPAPAAFASDAGPRDSAVDRGSKPVDDPAIVRVEAEGPAAHVEVGKSTDTPAVLAEAARPIDGASLLGPIAPPSETPAEPGADTKPSGTVANVQEPGDAATASRPDTPPTEKAAARGEQAPTPKAAAKATADEKDFILGDISLASIMAELDASAAPDEGDVADAARANAPPTDVSAIALLAKNGLPSDTKVPAAVPPPAPDTAAPAGDGVAQAPAWVILDEAPPRSPTTRLWGLGCVAAAALFALQVLHHYRAHLAVVAGVGPIVRQAYAMLDAELAPQWDLDQYEIEIDWDSVAQPGASGAPGNLKIAARIRNKGPRKVPLPHVQVELKDRWESTIGSRVFAPSEYLPRGARLDRMMVEGQTMVAQLDIVDPGTEAYGFELDVCVEAAAGALRCAADAVFR